MEGYVFLVLLALGAFILFNPVTWIVIIAVIVIVSSSKKKKNVNASAPNAKVGPGAKPTVAPKPANPMAKWNWLLYIGSFLIVLAMMYFINTIDGSYVAPSTVILTILIYAGGIVLHKMIDYLRPVAKAFIYSALCMIPLWLIAFSSMGMPDKIVPICVSSAFMVATFLSAFLLDDNLLGHVAFTSIVLFMWSFTSLLNLKVDSGPFCYIIHMSPALASILPVSLYLSGASLPVAFKEASKNIGTALWQLGFCTSLILFVIPGIATVAPLLRTICALLFLAFSFAFWYKTRKRYFSITMRIGIQTLVLAIVADIMDFSVGYISGDQVLIRKAVCFVSAWLVTFAGQVLYSLYCKKPTKSDESAERAVSIASMACILFAPGLCFGLPSTANAIIWIIVCLLLAIFGIAYAFYYKNVSWSIATATSVMIIPYVIGYYIAEPKWDSVAYVISYGVISLIFLLGAFLLQKIQKKETQIIGAISIVISCLAMTNYAIDANMAYLGYMLSAVFFSGFAMLINMDAFYEVAVYVFSIGLMQLFGDLLHPAVGSHRDTNEILRQVIDAHIIGIAFIGTQLISKYIYKKSDKTRFIIGYSLFSIVMTGICASLSSSGDIGWALLFLVEQVVALLYSVTKREKWLIWFSSIEIFIVALRLTEGLYFLWMGLIGVGLIAIVIWQLSKANKQGIDKNTKPAKPSLPEEQKAPEATTEQKEDTQQ